MSMVYNLTAFLVILAVLFYTTKFNWKKLITNHYFSLLVIGIGFRLFAFSLDKGYYADLITFIAWAGQLANDGITNFYYQESVTSMYPPGYMYVLLLIGNIFKLLGIGGNDLTSKFLIQLPAIICDIITGIVIYKFAYKRFHKNIAWIISACFLLNPAIILDSSIWGQVDSVYTLIIIYAIYLLANKKYIYCYIVFGISVLFKPQSLIFTPLFLYGIFLMLKEGNFTLESFKKAGTAGFSGIVILFIGVLPFGRGFDLSGVINQYKLTLSSYPLTTLNAYNLYNLIGKNWVDINEKWFIFSFYIWGTIFVVIIAILGIYFIHRNNSKANFFYVAALINLLTFIFASRMHERYLYPTITLFLVAYIFKKDKKILLLYGVFSITNFINVVEVLNMSFNNGDSSLMKFIFYFSAVNLIFVGISIFYEFKLFNKISSKEDELLEIEKENEVYENHSEPFWEPVKNHEFERSLKKIKLKKIDYILMATITIIYGAVAFINLGSTVFPTTTWTGSPNNSVVVDLKENTKVGSMMINLGARDNKELNVEVSYDNVNWSSPSLIKASSVFAWNNIEITSDGQYLKFTPVSDETMIQEIAILDENKKVITPTLISADGAELFDEQNTIPEHSSFENSTYFDEIYHVRTAYEFIHHLYVYEYTHPPFGKFLISLGIRMFGLNPFGWRFMGTLFGALMLPIMYLLGYKIFRKTFWATFATVLFATDFMHFAQTRIATIDTYVTIFIMLMYYFMYQYTTQNTNEKNKKGFRKSIIILLFSGIFMGLAMASKWPGIYAVSGIVVIFFIYLFNRYLEWKADYLKYGDIVDNYKLSDSGYVSTLSSTTIGTIKMKNSIIKSIVTGVISFLYILEYYKFSTITYKSPAFIIIFILITYFCLLYYFKAFSFKFITELKHKNEYTLLILSGVIACLLYITTFANITMITIFVIVLIVTFIGLAITVDWIAAKPKNLQLVDNFIPYTRLTLILCVIIFIIVPVSIYCITYIPFLNTAEKKGFIEILYNQRDMFKYHGHLVSTHPFSSKWYEWPFDIRPIFYFAGENAEGLKAGISSFGNPIILWTGVIAFFFCIADYSKTKDKRGLFLIIAFFAQYLPWTLIGRTTYIYHYFPSIPFIILMITYMFSKLNLSCENNFYKKVALVFAGICIIVFIMFYPILSGMYINPEYVYKILQWLPRWQLI